MYSEEEKQFIAYWEKNRGQSKRQLRQWLFGIPLGLAFAVPIALNFFSSWHKKAKMEAAGSFNPLVLLLALVIIVVFTTIFYRQYQRDQYEQRYQELKAREGKKEG